LKKKRDLQTIEEKRDRDDLKKKRNGDHLKKKRDLRTMFNKNKRTLKDL